MPVLGHVVSFGTLRNANENRFPKIPDLPLPIAPSIAAQRTTRNRDMCVCAAFLRRSVRGARKHVTICVCKWVPSHRTQWVYGWGLALARGTPQCRTRKHGLYRGSQTTAQTEAKLGAFNGQSIYLNRN